MAITVQAGQVPLHFKIINCSLKGENKHGMKKFDMRVSFGRGKLASLTVEAETSKIALEIVETLAQQYDKMNAREFHKYRTDQARKRTVFRFVLKHDAKRNKDRIVVFKPSRTRQGDIEPAFGRKKGPSKGISRAIQLEGRVIQAIDTLDQKLSAKLAKKQHVKPKPPGPRGVHVNLDAK